MRALCASFLVFVFLSAASAADLKVKVIDPQSAAVGGAQVSLFAKGRDTALRIARTSAEGVADFGEFAPASYKIRVLAAGFALRATDIEVRCLRRIPAPAFLLWRTHSSIPCSLLLRMMRFAFFLGP